MSKNNKGKVVQMLSPENYIRKRARTLPIYDCVVNSDWEKSKIAHLSVARKHTNGNITVCSYLVDLMCLGVKDTDYRFNIPMSEYLELIDDINTQDQVSMVPYEVAHNIVFAGLEFADEYGFKPHKDFTSVTRFMLEEDTEDVELIEIDCGLNGQPAYMPGPFDDEVKINKIIAQLEKTAGHGNYSLLEAPEYDDDEFDEEDEDDDEFVDDDDEYGFNDMPAPEKKELFLDLYSRIDSMTDEEHDRFTSLVDSIVNDLIDIDLHNKIYDEYYDELNIETDEDIIPDQLLGRKPGDPPVSEEIKNQFIKIYSLTTEEQEWAAKEMKIFRKKAKGLACADLLELFLLQAIESDQYPTLLEEFRFKHPDYQMIKLLWVIEQVTVGHKLHEIPESSLTLSTFFPGREAIHPIEKYYFLSLLVFVAAAKNDINRIEAFDSVLADIGLSEMDEEVFGEIISTIKINYLVSYLKN